MGGSHASHLTPLQRPLEAKSLVGSWYIQRGLPAANFLEKHAHHAVETYKEHQQGNLILYLSLTTTHNQVVSFEVER